MHSVDFKTMALQYRPGKVNVSQKQPQLKTHIVEYKSIVKIQK